MPRTIRIALFVLFLGAFAAYGLYQAYPLIQGPILNISSPSQGETLTNASITIDGETENISFLYLNNEQIFTNLEGEFSEKLILLPGYNIITVRATDKFNRERIETLHLILENHASQEKESETRS